jgi:alpha-mannosidase
MHHFTRHKKIEFPRLLEAVRKAMYEPVADLTVVAYITKEPLPFAQRTKGKKTPLKIGQNWGNLFDCGWFHFTGHVPASIAGKPTVLLIDVSGEGLVVDAKGNPVLGLTTTASPVDSTSGHLGKKVLPIASRAKAGEKIDVWMDAGCNDLFGRYQGGGALLDARVAVCHEPMRGLYYDLEVLGDLLQQLPEDTARHQAIWAALGEAMAAMNHFTDAEVVAARARLAPELARRNADPPLTVSAVGHSHIDLAWLWPIRETIRKSARTFATVLALMDRYKDFIFGQSQPQLYQWMKDYYPDLYRRIKKAVASGQMELQGGMWVESDTNVPSGEALVRQILYGQRFFRQEFGKDVRILWMPDVFGYSGALPQILKKAGIDYFMTQKLSMNKVNVFPHHSFWWEGIDGTRVLTHMLPENTYNGPATPRAVARIEHNYADKAVCDRAMMVFGIGDGGGGPGEDHIERLARQRNLAGQLPVVQEPSEKFFKRLERRGEKYASWSGELYFEHHQGTFTSQGRNKRFNRKMELGLRELEVAAVEVMLLAGAKYPVADLERIWKETLLYQFHDILPGSSITRVYEESLARYAVLKHETDALISATDARLAAAIDTSAFRKPVVLSNSLSWGRRQWMQVGGKWRKVEVPAMGYATVEADAKADTPAATLKADAKILENGLLRVTFNADGSIAQVFDKANGRNVLRDTGNRLAVYRDDGNAWDFVMHYAERPAEFFRLVLATVRIDGPRATIHQECRYGKSMLSQDISITDGSRRIDFVTKVDWRESRRMLRTSFPLDIMATEAVCDIQFGTIRRPTHTNTSWDFAKYEVCAHKWVDISQRDYGVALLNDCKYGYKVHGNVLDLNLLRSSWHPDPVADRASHEFTYSLYPHSGDHVAGGVMQAGYELNVPIRAIAARPHRGRAAANWTLAGTDAPGVIIDGVKKAEDDGSIILRAFEHTGGAALANIRLGFDIKSAQLVDLMEEHPRPLKLSGRTIQIPFKPFEIQSIRMQPKR